MSLKVSKTASGTPLLNASTNGDVYGQALGAKWKVAAGDSAGTLFTDPACPLGVQVTYSHANSHVTYTRASSARDILTSENGRECYEISVVSDSREIRAGEKAFTLASGKITYRFPLTPPNIQGELTIECSERVSNKLARLIAHSQALWLAHNKNLCEVPGCDRPAVELLRPVDAVQLSRTARKDNARARMAIQYAVLNPDETKGSAATVGEACAVGATCGESLESIIKRVNGVS